MFQSVIGFLGAPFTELIIFILLVTYVVIYRHHKHLAGISKLKVIILLVIFIYFAWMPIVWPSLIPWRCSPSAFSACLSSTSTFFTV